MKQTGIFEEISLFYLSSEIHFILRFSRKLCWHLTSWLNVNGKLSGQQDLVKLVSNTALLLLLGWQHRVISDVYLAKKINSSACFVYSWLKLFSKWKAFSHVLRKSLLSLVTKTRVKQVYQEKKNEWSSGNNVASVTFVWIIGVV